jgi:hypothetical protein
VTGDIEGLTVPLGLNVRADGPGIACFFSSLELLDMDDDSPDDEELELAEEPLELELEWLLMEASTFPSSMIVAL